VSGLHRPGVARIAPRSADEPRRSASGRDGRAVIALPPVVADVVRRMGEQMGNVSNAEVVRRGLMLLDFMLRLAENEELAVHNRDTGECERIRFAWELLGRARS
jgi:hypothetical protein